MEYSFASYLLSAQIAVFSPPNLAHPFNAWTPRHYEQGFAWRPGSVSFLMIEEYGDVRVTVLSAPSADLSENAIRVIKVPFQVDPVGLFAVSNLVEVEQVGLPAGMYDLYYETGVGHDNALWCRFILVKTASMTPAQIVKWSDGLSPVLPLLMEADPAM